MEASKRLTILIVEDDPADARLVMLALAPYGAKARLVPFRTLAEAQNWLIAGNTCDVALLDLSLPDSFGFDTIKRIRELAPSLAVIVLTGLDDDEFAMRAMEAGTQDYLVKGAADGVLIWRSIQYAVTRMRMEEQLRIAQQRVQAIIDLAQDAIIAFDADLGVSLFNPAAERMFGYDRGEMIGDTLRKLLPGIGDETGLGRIVADCRPAPVSVGRDGWRPDFGPSRTLPEFDALRRDGSIFPVEVAISSIDDPAGKLFTMVLRDISERKATEEELRRLATTDSLTGTANRRQFMETAEKELARLRRYGRAVSVLMLDVDHFKSINDNHGHAAGDQVLVGLADVCRDCLRECDIIGRLGGEEFAIVLPETDEAVAMEVAERLRHRLSEMRIQSRGGDIRFTVSVGVAAALSADISIEAALSRADHALYAAKRAGRDRVILAGSDTDVAHGVGVLDGIGSAG